MTPTKDMDAFNGTGTNHPMGVLTYGNSVAITDSIAGLYGDIDVQAPCGCHMRFVKGNVDCCRLVGPCLSHKHLLISDSIRLCMDTINGYKTSPDRYRRLRS